MIARGRLRKCDICGYTDFQEDVCRSGIIQPYDDDGWATDPKERDLCPKCAKELNHVWENYIKKNGLKRRFNVKYPELQKYSEAFKCKNE